LDARFWAKTLDGSLPEGASAIVLIKKRLKLQCQNMVR